MEYEHIIWELKEDGVGVITMNRPNVFNALSQRMNYEILDIFGHIDLKELSFTEINHRN